MCVCVCVCVLKILIMFVCNEKNRISEWDFVLFLSYSLKLIVWVA